MIYTEYQIKAAFNSAALLGFPEPSREEAIAFLDWYFSAKTEYSSVEEAKRAGLLGLVTNGVRQQAAYWKELYELKPTLNP
jgi:hypothetical protein